MIKIILASHGSLAEGMNSAVKMILGNSPCEAYGLDTYEEPDNILNIVEKKVEENKGTQFIVFTDINGGSVQNKLLQLCKHENVFVQTGMCLSMVLETILTVSIETEEPIEVIMERICESAKENMLGCSCNTTEETEEDELW